MTEDASQRPVRHPRSISNSLKINGCLTRLQFRQVRNEETLLANNVVMTYLASITLRVKFSSISLKTYSETELSHQTKNTVGHNFI